MNPSSTFEIIDSDFQLASQFQTAGDFPRARVSARMAAGKAAKFFINLNSPTPSSSINPYQALINLRTQHQLPLHVVEAINLLLQKVNPDYSFPRQNDLLQAAQTIISYIKKEVFSE
jgi:hypothetical protein